MDIGILIVWFLKTIFGFIDSLIYWADAELYDLMMDIASAKVFQQETIMTVAERVYQLLGLIMLFKLIFSFLTYIINPDEMQDKTKGLGNIIKRIIITLCLIVITPWAFEKSRDFQLLVIEDKVIEYFVFGQVQPTNASAGYNMMHTVGKMFVSPYKCTNSHCTANNDDDLERCDADWHDDLIFTSVSKTSNGYSFNLKGDRPGFVNNNFEGRCGYGVAIQKGNNYYGGDFAYEMFKASEVDGIDDKQNIFALMQLAHYGMRYEKWIFSIETPAEFLVEYQFIISTAVGIFIGYMLILMCIDVAVRSVKLAFYEIISPIPIISYIGMKDGKDAMLNKWFSAVLKTYADLFTRVAGLQLAVFFINEILKTGIVVNGDGIANTIFVNIFLILGALTFAKELPKILEGMGIKFDSGGFNLKKKFTDNMALGKNIWGAGAGALKAGGGLLGNAALLPGRVAAGAVKSAFSSLKNGLGKGFQGEWKKENFKSSHQSFARGIDAAKARMRASGRASWERLKVGGASAIGREYKSKIDSVGKEARNLRNQYDMGRIGDQDFGDLFGKTAGKLWKDRGAAKGNLDKAREDLTKAEQDFKSGKINAHQFAEYQARVKTGEDLVAEFDKRIETEISSGIGGDKRKEQFEIYKRAQTFKNLSNYGTSVDEGRVAYEQRQRNEAAAAQAEQQRQAAAAQAEQQRQAEAAQAEQQRQEQMQANLVSGIGDAMRDAMSSVNTGLNNLNDSMSQMGTNMQQMGESLRKMQTDGIKTRESHITQSGTTVENSPYRPAEPKTYTREEVISIGKSYRRHQKNEDRKRKGGDS